MTDVTLYGVPQSGFTRTALLALAEKGVDYELQGVEFGSEAHRALHPFARIPILQHGEFVVYESAAIGRYVDRVFEGPALQPAEPRALARMDQWISAHNDYFVATITKELLFPRLLFPSRGITPDEDKIAQVIPRIVDYLAVAENALSQNAFFAGDAPSLADLVILPTIIAMGQTPEGKSALEDIPAIGRWRDAMTARPSFAATAPPAQSAAA